MKVARELHAAVYNFAEVYDPATDEWTQAERMAGHRYDLGAVVLSDGRVLAAGGVGTANLAVGTAEIWDSATGTWTATADMSDPRE